MRLRKFKKIVLKYFELHTVQKRKVLKKACIIVKIPFMYCCIFTFAGIKMRLLYYKEGQKWFLEPFSAFDKVPEELKYAEGNTIEQCCGILWRFEHDKQAITRPDF